MILTIVLWVASHVVAPVVVASSPSPTPAPAPTCSGASCLD